MIQIIMLRKFMNKMQLHQVLLCLAGAAIAVSSCSSVEDAGPTSTQGAVQLSVNADATFGAGPQSRAVNESLYADVSKYTVQIIDAQTSSVKKEFLYADAITPITLDNGSYLLKAFYGRESEVSDKEFYVEGSTSFNIQGETVENVNVNCVPTCGKVTVRFDSAMSEFFSDYSVVYETKALTAKGTVATWTKTSTDPLYLKVDKKGETVTATIKVIRKSDNKNADVVRTYNLAPNKSWTLSIAPQNNDGQIGIVITVDESTNDHPVDIVVPSDWI